MTECISEGLYRIPVPLPGNPLRELNSYLLRGRERSLLIDTGFRQEEGRRALFAGLAELDVDEERVPVAGLDVQLKLDSSSAAKIHAGTAHLKNNTPNAPQDPEVKFILDMDLSMGGNTPCGLAAAALETLHGHSSRVFEGAVTDTLRDAMGRA